VGAGGLVALGWGGFVGGGLVGFGLGVFVGGTLVGLGGSVFVGWAVSPGWVVALFLEQAVRIMAAVRVRTTR